MKNSKITKVDIDEQEDVLQTLIERSNKDDLVQCIRLISLYVSIYKKHFGELPTDYYEDLFRTGDFDNSSTEIFEDGLNEAIAMLDMIIKTSPGNFPYMHGSVTIN